MTESTSSATDGKSVATRETKEKPMSATERKMLKELIDNDFSVLRSEVRNYGEELKRLAIQRVEEEFAQGETACRTALAEWFTLKAQLRQQIDNFLNGKREQGLSWNVRYQESLITLRDPEFVVSERERAITHAKNDVDREVNVALTELERRRVELHREILLSGLVSTQAKDLLDQQPNARDILSTALAGNPRFRTITHQAIEGTVQTEQEEQTDQNVHIPEVLDS